MAEAKNLIKHDGVIIKLEERLAWVRVLVHSGCASCQIKGACGVADQSEKIIEVPVNKAEYKTGEKVVVSMAQSLGFKALFYGYMLPFVIILSTLLIASVFIHNEGMIAGLALLIAAVYYIILYFVRDKMKKVFNYRIEKKNNLPLAGI